MAVLDPNLNRPVYTDGLAERTCLFPIHNVTTGDSLDVSASLSSVKIAVFLSTTASVKGIPTINGTVVTITTAGLSADAGYLLVWGSAAS